MPSAWERISVPAWRDLKAKYGFIVEVRGRGLLWAVEFNKDMAEAVMLGCVEKGLLVNKLKPNAIRLIPPLIITKKDVDERWAYCRRCWPGRPGSSAATTKRGPPRGDVDSRSPPSRGKLRGNDILW